MEEQARRFLQLLAPQVRGDAYGRKTDGGYELVREKLAPRVLERHLEGSQAIGVYPVMGDEVQTATLDFDDHEGDLEPERMVETVALVVSACMRLGLKPLVFRSGGGRGMHVWFFWANRQKARFVRCHLRNLLASVGLTEGATGVKAGAVEIFPKQDRVETGGFGSLIALPGARQSVPLDASTLAPIPWAEFDPADATMALSAPVPEVAVEESEASAFVQLPGDEEVVASALAVVSSDDYGQWLRVALALKNTFGDQAYASFAEWSQKSEKYPGDAKARRFWEKLPPNGAVGLGTIFHLAKQAGWNGTTHPLIREMNAKYGIYTHGRTTEIIVKGAEGGPENVFIGKGPFIDRLAGDSVPRQGEDGKTTWTPKSRIWLNHSKAAHYTQVVFDPSRPPGHNGEIWNLWRGFALTPEAGDWSLLKDHIRENISNGDGQVNDWLLNWMALGVQQPGLVIGTAPVLIGFPGTGKGLLAHSYGSLWGPHFAPITHPEHVTGRFSGHLFARRFIYIDEGTFGGNRKDAGVIKTRITDPLIMSERKGVDAITMKNSMIFMVASNEASVVPADKGDRRWMVIEVSDRRREDRTYFKAIAEQMERGGQAAMLHELLQRDISQGPDPRRTIKTEALFEQMLLAQPAEVRYLHGILDQGRLPQNWIEGERTTTIRAMVEELHHLYRESSRIDDARLGRFIHKVVPTVQTSQGGVYFIRKTDEGGHLKQRSTRYFWPPLARARLAFAKYVNMPVPWTAVGDWQSDPDPDEGEGGADVL